MISWVKKDSAAAQAKLQPGDKIVRIDGIENPTWELVEPHVMLSPDQPMDVTIQRGDKTFNVTITPKAITASKIGSAGWYPSESVMVGDLELDKPAAQAGIHEDDKIIAMNGVPLPSIDAMIEGLQETKEKLVELTVIRNGKALMFNVKPVLSSTEDPGEKRYRIGFMPEHEMKVGRLSFTEAVNRSLQENKKTSLLILELVKKLIQGKISPKTIEGPIGIGRAAGVAATEKGWTPLLGLTAAISLNLGIFNLLPIPILDGGVIMLLFVESLMRRDISLHIKERIYQAAFVFLILFAAMVIFNDLQKTLPGMLHRMP